MAETIIDKGSYAVVLELVNIYTKKAFAAKCIDQKKILDKPNAPVKHTHTVFTASTVIRNTDHEATVSYWTPQHPKTTGVVYRKHELLHRNGTRTGW